MKLMKTGLFFLFALNVFLFNSCTQKDCSPPEVSANIVGIWNTLDNEVEFKNDGTLIDPNDAIFGVEANGVVYDQKTWTATNSNLTITAATLDGSAESSADFEITGNECDKITYSIIGISVSMTRK